MKKGNCIKKTTVRSHNGKRITFTKEEIQKFTEMIEANGVIIEEKEKEEEVDNSWNEICAVSLELAPSDSIAVINLKGRKDSFFKLDRFTCFVYDESFRLMFNTYSNCMVSRGKTNWVTFQVPCSVTWDSNSCTLLVHDDDDDSLLRIIFTLDKSAEATLEVFRPTMPLSSGVFDMLNAYEEKRQFSTEKLSITPVDVLFQLHTGK